MSRTKRNHEKKLQTKQKLKSPTITTINEKLKLESEKKETTKIQAHK